MCVCVCFLSLGHSLFFCSSLAFFAPKSRKCFGELLGNKCPARMRDMIRPSASANAQPLHAKTLSLLRNEVGIIKNRLVRLRAKRRKRGWQKGWGEGCNSSLGEPPQKTPSPRCALASPPQVNPLVSKNGFQRAIIGTRFCSSVHFAPPSCRSA